MKPDQITTEQEFRTLLESIDTRLRALGKREGIASFHRLQGESHEDMEKLNDEVAALLLDKSSRAAIEAWKDRVQDSRLKRQAEIFSKALSPVQPGEKEIQAFQRELDMCSTDQTTRLVA